MYPQSFFSLSTGGYMLPNLVTFDKVREKVEALSLGNFDDFIPVNDISFDSLDTVRIAGSETHTMRPIAQQLICNRLGTPIQYLRKCPIELQQENLNHWIRQERNSELFFRFNGENEVRAVFTDRYKILDNWNVVERLSSLGYSPDTTVKYHLDDEFMSLSIPDGGKTFKVNGDKITPGISINNSEVGLASLSIASFFLRLVCTNGMISQTEFSASYRHVSMKVLDEFPERLKNVSQNLLNQSNLFSLSIQSRVENPESTFKSFNRQFMLNEKEVEAVDWGFEAEPGNTMYHVINGYTKGAQFPSLPSAESRYKLEKTGGAILSMVGAN